MTDGTSAQFTNQSVPDATVRAGVHPSPVRSAYFNDAVPPWRSIQLSNTPRDETVNCGASLDAAAGESIRRTEGAGA
ncbi:MAG: hypothetical protein AMXMBFR57_04050 [Acidimicrobiia bacterium]